MSGRIRGGSASVDESIQARMRETEQALPANFDANIRRQIEAALAKALDENDEYFQREREKLNQWAEDQIQAAEQELHDTKARLKDVKRRARAATTVDEQAALQQETSSLERQQRRQHQQIFDVEDDIEAKRDQLIEALSRRMNQRSHTVPLFGICWLLNKCRRISIPSTY